MPSSQSTAVAATAAATAAAVWYLGKTPSFLSPIPVSGKDRLRRVNETAEKSVAGIPSGDTEEVHGKGTIVEVMRWRAQLHPNKRVYTYLDDAGTEIDALTFAMLDEEARKVAGLLFSLGVKKGDRVILSFPPGMSFICAFWGCLYAGAIAIPVYPPHPGNLKSDLPKFKTLVRDSGAKVALTNKEYYYGSMAGTVTTSISNKRIPSWPRELSWHVTDALAPELATLYDRKPVELTGEDLAFFQYSSGSTSTPKAVMIAHKCIMEQMYTWDSIQPDALHISWLPAYHDAGLVGYIIVPMYTASHCIHFSPIAFIKNPYMWLKLISDYRATHTCAPNFAYALAARKITDAQRDALDLTSLYAAICAAEPIRGEILDNFTEKFSKVGFRRESFNCGYGLAEVTLTCTRQDPYVQVDPVVLTLDKQVLENLKVARDFDPESKHDSISLVGCGFTCPKFTMSIVDPESLEKLPENRVGEIWVSSASNAVGYWGRESLSAEALCAKISGTDSDDLSYLRTGDMGFFRDGQLFVCGRIKDLIIVRGRNILPQDIELTVEEAAGGDTVRPGCSAAFAVDIDGQEKLVVVCELRTIIKDKEGAPADHVFKSIVTTIQGRVSEEHKINCHAIVLLKPRCIAKTTSGKIQRHASKRQYIEGSLRAQYTFTAEVVKPSTGKVMGSVASSSKEAGVVPSESQIEEWLLAAVVSRRGEGDFDAKTPWAALGLDSISLVDISAELGAWLDIVVPATLFFEYDTPHALAKAVNKIASSSESPVQSSTSKPQRVYDDIKEEYYDVTKFPEAQMLKTQLSALEAEGLADPYLRPIKTLTEDGIPYVNFNTYNYLGLATHPSVSAASKAAIDEYGTSMSSSPVVGQNKLNLELEKTIAEFVGVDAACVFLGGHSTNVTTIGHLVGPEDLIICDSLNHNSLVLGQKLSGATVLSFPHNNIAEADRILAAVRNKYRRVLITIEGVYSMDGDIPDLKAFIDLKKRHKCILYVDEAHSLGTIGATGRGTAEHCGVDPREVDVWMGTLSKSFGSAGGFIAGSQGLIDYLKHSCGGFVFSVGLSPANSAAALESLKIATREPERVSTLQESSRIFFDLVKKEGFNTGTCVPATSVVPVIVGNSVKCLQLSEAMSAHGINVKPIVFPAVEENAARLRFFMSYNHSKEDLERTCSVLKEQWATIMDERPAN